MLGPNSKEAALLKISTGYFFYKNNKWKSSIPDFNKKNKTHCILTLLKYLTDCVVN